MDRSQSHAPLEGTLASSSDNSNGNESVLLEPTLAFKGVAGENATRVQVDDCCSKSTQVGGDIRLVELHEQLSVDEMLQKWVGEFGRAQMLHFVLVSLAWTINAMHAMVMIFADRQPPWQCLPATSIGSLAQNTSNVGYGSMGCTSASSICEMDSREWEWIGGKGGSIISKWGLICSEAYKVGMVDSMFFVGAFCGAGIFGSLSDSFLGRKGVLQLVCIMNAVVGLATAFSETYWTYLALRLITGFSSGGIGLSSFVLATELIGPSWRGVVAMSVFYFFSTGIMLLSGIAYVAPSLRYLYVFVSLPTFFYLCLVLPFISESPRWYIIRGRTDEAMQVLRLFAKRNGRPVPPGVELASEISNCQELLEPNEQTISHSPCDLVLSPSVVDHSPCDIVLSPSVVHSPRHAAIVKGSPASNGKASGTLLDVLRYAETRTRMMVMVIVWFGSAIVYYGISLNVVNIGFNLYLSIFLNAVAEMPAFAITAILLKKLGRRIILVGSMLLSGGCCLMAVFLSSQLPNSSSLHRVGSVAPGNGTTNSYMHFPSPTHEVSLGKAEIGLVVCGMIAIFGMAASYNLIYLYTAELFPTVVRNAALGLASQASHVGAMTAPFAVVLAHFNPCIPFVIFSLSAISAGLLALTLPETLNRSLWDTLEGFKSGEIQQQIKNNGETHEK